MRMGVMTNMFVLDRVSTFVKNHHDHDNFEKGKHLILDALQVRDILNCFHSGENVNRQQTWC